MPSLIRMPAVAAGATEVVLSEWPVPEGTALRAMDPYAVIETDKAVVDLEAEADAVLLRARVFGEDRNVCNHHWLSDVEWGRTMAAATVARLHTNAEFRADMETAKAELAAVRAKGLPPTRDCAAEAAAMAIQPY